MSDLIQVGPGRFVRRPLPCRFLGPETGETKPCTTCGGTKQVAVRECGKHGRCSEAELIRPADGQPYMPCCRDCPDRQPSTFHHVAPIGTSDAAERWTGRAKKKPWEYSVTLALPHLNSVEQLRLCVELHRAQTLRPYILVLDTGSPPAVVEEVEKLRADDLECHFVRAHGYRHSSGPVSAAMDLAFSLCRSPYLVASHTDVFLRHTGAIKWLVSHLDDKTKVVGWEQSPRVGTDGWQGEVSHTFTAFDMRAMRAGGVTWNFERYYDEVGYPTEATNGFPDTEQPLNLSLRKAGIKPKLLGSEPNFERHITNWFDHARSTTGVRVYSDATPYKQLVEAYTRAAEADARARLREWGR